MKNILVAFSLLVFISACKQGDVEVNQEIMFSGIIANADGDTLMIRKDDTTEKFAVGVDGTFNGAVKGGEGFYQMRYKRKRADLYLTGGEEIILSSDFKDFANTLTFTGTGSKVNNYLKSKKDQAVAFDKSIPMKELYSLDEGMFQSKMNAYKETVVDHLKASELPSGFSAIQAKNIDYEFVNRVKRYESYYQYFAEDEDFEASEDFNKQFANLDFTNEKDFTTIPEYNTLVMSHFTSGELAENLDLLTAVKSGVIKDKVLKDLKSYYLSPGIDNLKATVDKMKALTTNTELLADLDESFVKMDALSKGNTSPGFQYKNVAGSLVNLEDLKGKNVYIDVWATWCGPCKAEIPHLKELEKSYHGQDVEFVSISVDVPEDEEKWKTMISEKELKGVQLLSDNGWDTDFVKDYLINGIPRFILLDKAGKIVSADAPRPSSDDELTDMINTLL